MDTSLDLGLTPLTQWVPSVTVDFLQKYAKKVNHSNHKKVNLQQLLCG